jgi:hypothetical protein
MKLKFDSELEFQQKAIAAITELFEVRPTTSPPLPTLRIAGGWGRVFL